ncbi:MAG: hypothetical protein ACXAEU_20440 [Candidatus Hodarchaeales archaeon]
MTGVCFAAFDDRKGPVPIFTTLEPALASKVAVKSIVSTLSAAQDSRRVEGEAIIPFPDENLVAFIYYASLDQLTESGDSRVISLSFLTESEKVNVLYQTAPKLSSQARVISQMINGQYKYGGSLPERIATHLENWGKSEEFSVLEIVSPPEKVRKEIDIIDTFNFYPVQKSFRSYFDPVSYIILSFLLNMPLVLVSPDPQFLLELANVFDKLFNLKELRIELCVPTDPEEQKSWSHEIPRADIVCLANDEYRRSYFSKDPVVIVTTEQEVKTPNHLFENDHLKMVNKWLEKARSYNDPEFSKKTVQLEIGSLIDKLEHLVSLAKPSRKSSMKELQSILKASEDELSLIIEIIRYFEYLEVPDLNKLVNPSKPYRPVRIQGKLTIGFIR